MCVNVAADRNVLDDLADILAIFDRGIPGLQVLQRDFVADCDIVGGRHAERRIVGRDHTHHVCSGLEVFDHDHANIVLMVVNKELRDVRDAHQVVSVGFSCLQSVVYSAFGASRS